MDRIERHDLLNAVGLAGVLMVLALLMIMAAQALFRTVDDGIIQSSAPEPAATTLPTEPAAPAGGEGAPGEDQAPADEQPVEAETTTTLPLRQPAEVTVRVGNGAQRSGIAAAGGDRLTSLGYDVVDLANAPPLDTSVVYFADGYQREAAAVARALGVPDTSVRAVPAEPELDASGVAVVVILGRDTTVG